MEVGRGGACVPARVALQGRIHRLQVCIMRNAQTFQRMEMPPLRMGTCLLRMETPLRGRSGGHTGAAPTISPMAPGLKVAGEQFADGLKREKVAGKQFADGLNQEKVAGEQFADGLNREKVAGE